jgi:hypothetical protein
MTDRSFEPSVAACPVSRRSPFVLRSILGVNRGAADLDFFRVRVARRNGLRVQPGSHAEAVKELGQAPSRPLIFRGFRRFRSEPVPFFHSLSALAMRVPAAIPDEVFGLTSPQGSSPKSR